MQFTDAVSVAGVRRTADGYLIAEARAVRTGVQLYTGREVGVTDKDIVRVYRPPEEVFADDSLRSASHMPVTVDHPKDQVTSDNWKDLAAGEVSTLAKKDGEWVQFPLILKDQAAISSYEAGKRELSAGYTCVLDWTPGTTADGEAYDARQTNIKFNHLALVDRARAGSEARIGDGAVNWGVSPLSPIADTKGTPMADNLQTVVLGDKAVQVADKDAPIIDAFKAKTAQDTAKLIADHSTAIATKDAELAKKDAEIDALKAKVVDGAALDKLVADRADLINTARAIAKDAKIDGLSDADIRKAVVTAKIGDAAIKDKPQAYIDARFDILAEEVKDAKPADPFREAVSPGLKVVGDARAEADQARQTHLQNLRDAWKTPSDAA